MPAEAEGRLLEKYMRSIHPEDVPGVKAALERAIETGGGSEADYRIMQGEGSLLKRSAKSGTMVPPTRL